MTCLQRNLNITWTIYATDEGSYRNDRARRNSVEACYGLSNDAHHLKGVDFINVSKSKLMYPSQILTTRTYQ